MKRIKLTQGKFAIVDDADYRWLNQWKWYVCKGRNTFYALRNSPRVVGKKFAILMHREILGLKHYDKQQCDHQDHNGLNNQRLNLRICTNQENNFNRKAGKGSSKFKGVSWNKSRLKWRAYIHHNGKTKYIGSFQDEVHAAQAYNIEAQKLYGDFMRLNNVA